MSVNKNEVGLYYGLTINEESWCYLSTAELVVLAR